MEYLQTFLDGLKSFAPAALMIVAVVALIVLARFLLHKRYAGAPGSGFKVQLVLLLLSFIGLLAVILVLPISENKTGQLLSLIGILLSAAIALSATTFVGNIMAGLMLRAVGSFRPGDFVRVGDHFGRVSDQGLFHTEIQTEDRDLTTMPNLYLVNNPVKVIRSSGTLVTADVSLGYDVSRGQIEKCLLNAARKTELKDPFVQVMDLGDFSVTYRVAGILTEVKSLISTRSRLRCLMLDSLHENGIEIVSPTFMNQRVLPLEKVFIPKEIRTDEPDKTMLAKPEDILFDKAEQAESIDKLWIRHQGLLDEIEQTKKEMGEVESEAEKAEKEQKIEVLRDRAERLAEFIKERQKQER